MHNAIIFHGTCDDDEYFSDNYPSLSNSHWLPWLQKQLLMKGIETATPEVFEANIPAYEKYLKELNRYNVSSKTILVGHSCGAGFILRWLSDNPDVFVDRVVLVAPWLDPDRSKTTDFFDFEIDPGIIARTEGLVVFHSDNDMVSIKESVEMIHEKLPEAKYQEFHNYGHFCFKDMNTVEFPELRDVILSK